MGQRCPIFPAPPRLASAMTRAETTEGEAAELLALAGPGWLAARLEATGYRLLRLSAGASPPRDARATPRLVLLAAPEGDPAPLVGHLQAVRKRWPLVDALVLAPEASPQRVRELLRAGARDVVLESDESSLLAAIEETLDTQRLLPMVDRLAERRVRSSRFEGMLSRSHAMWDVFETCARVAPTDANVLICGETGTGKELLARALHRRSKRGGRFVAINCSSLPEHLIESELFGHEKGAFTGATRARRGIFRNAEGGTVLLDEIGDMPEAAQQRLLRVLEDRSVRPVGGSDEVAVDVRVVAATHVPLEEAVADGDFREDLFYRLDVIRLDVPPLRDRPEDVVYLFGHFVKSLAKHYGVDRPEMNDDFLARLVAYSWPGNVRELENFSERIVLRGKRTLGAGDFSRFVRQAEEPEQPGAALADDPSPPTAGPASPIDSRERLDTAKGLAEALRPVVERLEKQYLETLLEETGGRIQETARLAKVSRRTLQRKLVAHGIDKARFRSR
jgi:DNA-binding NtrC family response regulator